MAHDFVRTGGEYNKYHYTIHCTKCGYVCWHGNDSDTQRSERQDCIPTTCSGDTEAHAAKIINLKQERDNLKQALFDVINFTGLSSDGKKLCFGGEIDGVSGVTLSRNYPSTAKMINELMGGE